MDEVQKSFLEKIYERLIQGEHNDIKLVFRDGSSTGSKLCLAALSPYFEAMFTHDMLEKNNGVVKLPTVYKTTFDDVHRFYFLDDDVVNDVNWFLLLDVAEMMQLDDLKSHCVKYLNTELTLTTENCIPVWRLSNIHGFVDFFAKAFQYVVTNLEELSNSGILMCLNIDEYLQVLSRDDLSQKEDEIIRDVQTWIEKNNPSRETMVQLFKKIRFEHVSIGYLTDDVIFTKFVEEHEALLKVVQEGLERQYFYKEEHGFIGNRFSGQLCDVMVVLNGTGPLLSVFCPTDKRWYSFPYDIYEQRQCFSGVVLGNSIYITGGSGKEKSTIIYNTPRKTWSSGPDLKHKRQNHCMAALDGTLYAIGGEYSSSIEQLQSGHNKWKVVGDLGCRRQDCCAEAVGENILIMSGRVGGQILYRFQCFYTKTHTVCPIYNIQMKTGYLFKSYLEMPTIYLLHYTGDVDVIHIDDVDKPTMTVARVAQYDAPRSGSEFGFVYKHDSIIVVSRKGIHKLNIRDGSKQALSCDNKPSLNEICGSLNMVVPRLYLL